MLLDIGQQQTDPIHKNKLCIDLSVIFFLCLFVYWFRGEFPVPPVHLPGEEPRRRRGHGHHGLRRPQQARAGKGGGQARKPAGEQM